MVDTAIIRILLQRVQDWGLISLALLLSLAIFAMPQTVSAAHEGIDIDTLPYPKAECISGENNGACYVAEAILANGSKFVFSIDNSMLHRDGPVQTQTQANSVPNSNDDGDDSASAESFFDKIMIRFVLIYFFAIVDSRG